MKLLIDLGNSRLKWAAARDGELLSAGAFPWRGEALQRRFEADWRRLEVSEVWVASVAGEEVGPQLEGWCARRGLRPRYARSMARACGLENGYREPSQLGVDRFLAMIGAWRRYRRALCVVDCGTAVTVDGVSAEGVFLGGVIAPGLTLMREALALGTQGLRAVALPLPEAQEFCARSTAEGIAAGTLHALVGFIERACGALRARLGGEVLTVLTGGEADRVGSALAVPCEHEPHLVLRGLAIWSEEMS